MHSSDPEQQASSAAEFEPTLAAASPAAWRAWLARASLGPAGLVLLIASGFAVLSLALLAYVADNVLDRETQQFDQNVLAAIHQFSSPQLDLAARAVSTFGSELVAVFSLALVVWCGVQRRWGAATSLVLVVGGAQLLNDLLKQFVHRARPTPVGATLLGQAYSFPSGHAMVGIAFYTFVAYLGWRLLDGWKRALWVLGLSLLVLLIGLSRLYLEVHYPTDVLAGYLAGFIWADAVLIGGHLVNRRRTPSRARDLPQSVALTRPGKPS